MRRMNVVNRKQALKVVKELDAFPKVLDDCKETTASGGGVSILVFVFIFILIISEIIYQSTTSLKFDYQVDTGFDGKLKINIDLTVAMRCGLIGADALDATGQDTHGFGELSMDDTYFELTPKQLEYFQIVQEVNEYLRSEYHALQDLMWLSTGIISSYRRGMPKREVESNKQPDACRVHGSLEVNKVAGNFHITAGKSIPVFPRGHAHISMMVHESEYNFSHRIEKFSFGDSVNGIVNPLDGEEQITTDSEYCYPQCIDYHLFQYFMKVVPTEVRTYRAGNVNTYQYAVTERNRTINHSQGSHGIPGIFIKYDLNALKIRIREQHQPFLQFLVRLCGIVGGVFAVSGMLHNWTGTVVDIVCCRYGIGTKAQHSKEPSPTMSLTETNQDVITGPSLIPRDNS
ncbi:hypothetical protein FSP39_007659 [Pinctada imbricata]|uniref:Endoplasmic reticulum-Golgi intermediate compartment protein 2 n=1 Tax=Pinctada imbricata TaxID=66713 RepID=A0AA88YQB6_PINIB|nr:hypothetical protein FSP39_007659 [Pinctada imbricata]